VPGSETRETSVCAVVVTYNRAELLSECLDALDAQSRPPDRILVVDNASTDDTPRLLADRGGFDVLTLDSNGGGAGGFARGLEVASRGPHEWFWLLDDDTMAERDCLRALLDGAARAPRPPSVLASVVRWTDGRLHPMNNPWLRLHHRAEFAEGAGAGLAAIRASTFVSALVHRRAVAAHGIPPAHFFVWLDDMDYTGRILRHDHGYIVPESVACHKTPQPYNTLTDARDRFYYKARNHLWLLRGDAFGGFERLGYAVGYVKAVRTYLRDSPDRGAAVRTTWRGVRDGLRPIPR
jgi:rhamnopyranosyl-N-acetylglucosaminyl-diphospho-decaprenol beta-1,3/1,4-galactofuranosyltransferase